MLYHEREGKNKEQANFVHIVYIVAKLCNIFDEAFFIDVSIDKHTNMPKCSFASQGPCPIPVV